MDEVTIKAKRELAVNRMSVICNMSAAAATVLTREMSTDEITNATNRVKDGTAKVENMKIVEIEGT
jgi:hypothetical protein